MAEPAFVPNPEYTQAAYAEELRLARERVVYLTACLRQVQAEATSTIAGLQAQMNAQKEEKK